MTKLGSKLAAGSKIDYEFMYPKIDNNPSQLEVDVVGTELIHKGGIRFRTTPEIINGKAYIRVPKFDKQGNPEMGIEINMMNKIYVKMEGWIDRDKAEKCNCCGKFKHTYMN